MAAPAAIRLTKVERGYAQEHRICGMQIRLGDLGHMHPRLPGSVVSVLVARAALALERNGHRSGAQLRCDLDRLSATDSLSWPAVDVDTIDQHDQNRLTEDGAEAVALALAFKHRTWRVLRRLQREEHADWLLEEVTTHGHLTIALEVSGVARGEITSRLAAKLKQVAGTKDVDQRWAGVVGFEKPVASLQPASASSV
jgi:hypothetical protein